VSWTIRLSSISPRARLVELASAASKDGKLEMGTYLKSFDVDAHDGRGEAAFTDDLREAMKFSSAEDALSAWKTQSKVRPRREDGQPNRPLTAFTIAVTEAAELGEKYRKRDEDRPIKVHCMGLVIQKKTNCSDVEAIEAAWDVFDYLGGTA
jgi:hypothetical protein